MTNGVLAPDLFQQFLSQTGTGPGIYYLLFTYVAGTTTPQATYTDATLSVENANPIILNSVGQNPSGGSIWLNPTLTYKFVYSPPNDTNPPTSPIVTVDNVPGWDGLNVLTQQGLGQILYPQTAAEIAASVTPTNYPYPPGDLRRYGADPTGVNDSSPALIQAVSCCADVFDGYGGGGTYIFNSSVVLSSFPLTIRGQAAWPSTSRGFINGTKFILQTVAGANAGLLQIPSTAVYGLRIQNIGFTFQSFTTGQAAILALGDFRYSTIENCVFLGAGGSAATCIGICCKTTSVFTGGLQIRDNFFDALGTGIWLQDSCTTVKMYGNEFYGYSGAGSVETLGAFTGGSGYGTNSVGGFVSGTYYAANVFINVPLTGGSGSGATANIAVSGGIVVGVRLVAGGTGYLNTDTLSAAAASLGGTGSGFSIPVATVGTTCGNAIEMDFETGFSLVGPEIFGNYFEGWTNGIFSNGAVDVSQVCNYYAACTNGYMWLQVATSGAPTQIGNKSYGESGTAGAFAGYSNLDASQIGTPSLLTGGAFQSTRGFQEGDGAGTNLRSMLLGYPQTVTSGISFSGNGSMTWGSVTINSLWYSIAGRTLTVSFNIQGTAGGTPNTTLNFTIPGGFTCSQDTDFNCSIENDGSYSVSAGHVAASATTIGIYVVPGAGSNWTAGTVVAEGTIQIPVE